MKAMGKTTIIRKRFMVKSLCIKEVVLAGAMALGLAISPALGAASYSTPSGAGKDCANQVYSGNSSFPGYQFVQSLNAAWKQAAAAAKALVADCASPGYYQIVFSGPYTATGVTVTLSNNNGAPDAGFTAIQIPWPSCNDNCTAPPYPANWVLNNGTNGLCKAYYQQLASNVGFYNQVNGTIYSCTGAAASSTGTSTSVSSGR
jgi:hypothetical protein